MDMIMNGLQTALNTVISFVPLALAFLVILLIGWIIARVLRKVISKLLAKVGLDRVAERGGLRRFTGTYTMSQLSGTLVYFAVLLFTLQFAFNVFGANPVSELLNSLVAWLPHLFIAGVILVVAAAIANSVFEMASGAMASTSYGRPIARAAQFLIIGVGAIAALNQIGIATTVTTPILVTGLAMIAGVVIVGVGGGLIGPMRQRWERMLGVAESEASNMRARTNGGQQPSEFGQPAYTSSQYTGTAADTQQQQQQQSASGPQYYQPPQHPQQPPSPPQSG